MEKIVAAPARPLNLASQVTPELTQPCQILCSNMATPGRSACGDQAWERNEKIRRNVCRGDSVKLRGSRVGQALWRREYLILLKEI